MSTGLQGWEKNQFLQSLTSDEATINGVKLKSVCEDLTLSAERDDVRMTLLFLYQALKQDTPIYDWKALIQVIVSVSKILLLVQEVQVIKVVLSFLSDDSGD